MAAIPKTDLIFPSVTVRARDALYHQGRSAEKNPLEEQNRFLQPVHCDRRTLG
jgi:hypothetical protein